MALSKAWTHRVGTLKGVGRAAVAVGAALGAMAACQAFVTPPQPNIVGVAQALDGKTSQVCAFAQQFVAAWLPATAADRLALEQYVTLPPNQKLPKTPAMLVDSASCYTAAPKGAAGDAQLYVAFVSTLQRPYSDAPLQRGFYQVSVALTHDQPRAVDAPLARSEPGPGSDVKTAYNTGMDTASPVYSLVSGFVAAYLTGTPALDRYITGDSGLAAVGGYQSAVVTAIQAAGPVPEHPANKAVAHVVAAVSARTISPDVFVSYSYPLTLEATEATWMVKAIDIVPQVSAHTKPAPAGNTKEVPR